MRRLVDRPFTGEGVPLPKSAASLGLGARVQLNETVALAANYDGKLASDYAVHANVAIGF